MRDRLIELISQVQYMGGLEVRLAEYLLKNGVIVPPCKVGQTVYIIGWDDNIEEFTVKDIAYEEGNFGVYFYRFRAVMGRESDIHFTDTYIGNSVFLTRVEAEKALERSENGT